MISSHVRNLGAITSANDYGTRWFHVKFAAPVALMTHTVNTTALAMFGYAKHDLLGKNISMLIPAPMSIMHQEYIKDFVVTGKQVRIWL